MNNWILIYETKDFRRIFQSNVTIGNKGKQTSGKKQNLEKINGEKASGKKGMMNERKFL